MVQALRVLDTRDDPQSRRWGVEVTPRQMEILRFTADFIKKNGFSPTYAEIAKGIGSHGGNVYHMVDKLCEMGYMRRPKFQSSRALEIVKMPHLDVCPLCGSHREQR